MNVLVTGGRGLIGSAIATHLATAGINVISIDDGRAAVCGPLPGCVNVNATIEQAAADPRRLPDIHTVVHCAAPVGPVAILTADVLDDMTSATRAALRVAREHHARLIAFSSSEVYGTEHPEGVLVTPDDWSHRTEYSVGKIVTEQMCRRHRHETGLPVCVIRPWNVTGPIQSAPKGFVIPRMAHQAAHGEPVTVYQPGSQRRAFMAAGDLAVMIRDVITGRDHAAIWDGVPVDAAAPKNATSMVDLADMFGTGYRIVDPTVEHGPLFREAAAGSKLPPERPALRGWTTLDRIVTDAQHAAGVPYEMAA